MKYYVYEWFNVNTNEIFYVGKGCGKRLKVRQHNRFFNEYLKLNKCDSRIIKEFDNEKDAFEYEYERIKELKRTGLCKCNIYNGGSGGTTNWWTNDLREKYSKNNVMKSQKQRERMSNNNPMKNPETAKKVGLQFCRAVIINGIEYLSVNDACEKLNTSPATIKKWCDMGINSKFQKCRYKDSPQVEYTRKRYTYGCLKPVIYKDKTYECVEDLSKEIGKTMHCIYNWCKLGFDTQGNICRYVDDKRKLEYNDIPFGQQNGKTIKVNGIIYNSRAEAERKLNLCKGYLAPYIKGIRKNNKFICEYVNQQPSHRKSKYCTVEGSTTNG